MIGDYLRILRPAQWYKNLLVFLGIVFAKEFLVFSLYPILLLGFFLLCLLSGANYIINDIVDFENDRKHPEKRNRPIASGRVSKGKASVFAVVLVLTSLGISYHIHFGFFIFAVGFFVLTQFYTFFLKHVIFADVTTISINFVLRAVAGAVLINVYVSPWLIVCTFFFALFLALCKRSGDIALLKDEAKNTRKVLRYYTKELINISVATSAATLLLSYAMYSFLAAEGYLMMLTIPVVTFLVFRYLYLSISHPKIVRHPEKIFKDKQAVAGMAVWILMVFLILYTQII